MGFLEKINIYECLVLIGVYSFGLFVFMNGLLPNDPVIKVGESKFSDTFVDKLVLMVIDALRADFLFSSNYSEYWTKLNSYMNLKSATCSISTVQPPTVTLPRIKAIVSGRAPKFVDVLNNINAGAMADDNWVNRLAKLQWNLRFYGDDTWIKLFPKSFQDYDGTNSFYVNDFHEVDTNVTRHISTLMNSSTTWDGLILHYLGLDHIGHTQGPNGRSMPDKIREMDEVVHSILDPMVCHMFIFRLSVILLIYLIIGENNVISYRQKPRKLTHIFIFLVVFTIVNILYWWCIFVFCFLNCNEYYRCSFDYAV
ncbi:unnamed protein product [Trichobilharzia regenti]|nr:unnamed protein product [Trichobilharzia regenti]